MRTQSYVLIGALIIVLLVGGIALYWATGPGGGSSPQGDSCSADADCACTLRAPDACGKTGQRWACVENKCTLGFAS